MIINNIALFINDFMINLYNDDIKFYQIIIGLFIINFAIYMVCNIVVQIKYLGGKI